MGSLWGPQREKLVNGWLDGWISVSVDDAFEHSTAIDSLLLFSCFCCRQFSHALSDFARKDNVVPAVNPLISYLTGRVTNSLHTPLSVSPVGEPFRWALTPSPAAPCTVPYIFVRSMPLLISTDSPLPLLTRGRMKRHSTSLLLWLPQRARIKWISHHCDAHVAVCVFFEPRCSRLVIPMLLCASRLCSIQLERIQILLLFLPE